jgi:hypothetical protein
VCIKRDWDNRKAWHSSSEALAMLNSKNFKFVHKPPYAQEFVFDSTRTTVGAARGCLFVSSQDHSMWQTESSSSDYHALPGRCNLDSGFLDVWEAGSLSAAKTAICKRVDGLDKPPKHKPAQKPTGAKQALEPPGIPGFSTNVVFAYGVIQPRYAAWCMNGWLRRCCTGQWRGKKVGFVRYCVTNVVRG